MLKRIVWALKKCMLGYKYEAISFNIIMNFNYLNSNVFAWMAHTRGYVIINMRETKENIQSENLSRNIWA